MDEKRAIFGTPETTTDATKEVKVRLPVQHLVKLHGIKLLRGQNISDTVSEALSRYFAETGTDELLR